MEQHSTQSKLDTVVDYLWDHKVSLLISLAVVFFAVNAFGAMVHSFRSPVVEDTQKLIPTVEATTTVSIDTTEATTTEVKPHTTPAATATPPKVGGAKSSVSTIPTISQINLPNRITISRIGVDAKVSNPKSTSINVLNDQLTRTVVRYTGSGTMTQGNMLIMGHSSELPIIHNPLYKVFSQLKYLVAGDEIKVYSENSTNTYRVTSVTMLSIKDDNAYIPFSSSGSPKLTLVTCNVKGAKDQRYVVNAELVASN
jgi:LPXTG-site transpeptidase (sortase) family protein